MDRGAQSEQIVREAFAQAGHGVTLQAVGDDAGVDLVTEHDGQRFLVEIKSLPEGRTDRLIPMLSQAVLQAQAHLARDKKAMPVAVVVTSRVSLRGANQALDFVRRYAPAVGAGVMDLTGFRRFSGAGLESLNSEPGSELQNPVIAARGVNLFSDLNQWLLKLLLARHLTRPELLGAPVAHYRNASELAAPDAGNVSVMSTFRLIEALREEGFLHESSDVLQLVRVRELLERWQATYRRHARDLAVNWLLPSRNPNDVSNAVKQFGERACCGLFAAAHAHGFRHVTGVPIHLYVDNVDGDALARMGVVPAQPHEAPDLILRIPQAKETVFRAQVMVGRGYRACDILQVWLDVASYPARGQEQADVIYRKVIEPMLVGI
ncbi:MAG: hypothetical protein O2917_08165 [Acidobacteria bacterium]|nr:hypothetical protein [Acidobacteriota bacterium]